MSSFKFQVGEPRKVELSFDEPKIGKNDYGTWYLYGVKSDINSDEDSFFATHTLNTMIQTLGAKEGDELTIEKCVDGDMAFFKVNGLSITDMNNAGSVKKIEEAKPKPNNEEMERLIAENEKLKEELAELRTSNLSESDIPF